MGQVGTIRRKDSERNRSRILRDWTPEIDAEQFLVQGLKRLRLVQEAISESVPTYLHRIKVQSDPHGDVGAGRVSDPPFGIARRFRLPKVAKFLVG